MRYSKTICSRQLKPAASRQPPLVLRAVRRRPGRDRPEPPARARRLGAADAPPAPLAPKAPHFAPKAKSVIFLFMAGRPEPPRAVRLQARSSPSSTARCRRRSCSRATAPPSSTRTRKLLGPKFKFAKHGQAARSSPSCCHTARHRGRHRDRQVDAHRRLQPRARPAPDEHRQPAVRPAQHGRLGHLRPGQRVAGPARLRRLQLSGTQGPERRQLATGAAASCPPSTRACRSAAAATRCSTSPTRAASTSSCSATRSTPLRELNQHAPRRRWATPRSPPASAPSRWPSACSRAPPS